jgi:hypothetical protein
VVGDGLAADGIVAGNRVEDDFPGISVVLLEEVPPILGNVECHGGGVLVALDIEKEVAVCL